ncbi:helix-turn-helix transcriptional regulator [Fortiea contorta]|uniref:helix-turn-helix transcriptional regulator n=1 Tax=Fortiea contorta TaxID=1892405 RepID=UPI00034DFD7E|nr:AraC family transcriptional regulator [Fortiea contorta]
MGAIGKTYHSINTVMAKIISEAECQETWYGANKITQYPDPLDASDIIYLCPEQFGTGYDRCIELRDIDLLIRNQKYHDDLQIVFEPYQDKFGSIEFGFNLSANYTSQQSDITIKRGSKENFLQWDLPEQEYNSFAHTSFKNVHCLKVDIHLKSAEILKNFVCCINQELPPGLIKLIEGKSQQNYVDNNQLTPAMYLPLQQIINCPFQGMTKQIYLEAKCLELIALKLEQLTKIKNISVKSITLKPRDIEKIHRAREILIFQSENPPSLLNLAQKVGINDNKLKNGFRQIFGTTVFGYLHNHRMEIARQLLQDGKMHVAAVANEVGYANPGHFAAAFKRKFGVSPSECKAGKKICDLF